MEEKEVGTVSEFFARPMVAGIKLKDDIRIGDRLHFKGHTTDYAMTVASMQIDNSDVSVVKKGKEVGIKVPDRVRQGDAVYKVEE